MSASTAVMADGAAECNTSPVEAAAVAAAAKAAGGPKTSDGWVKSCCDRSMLSSSEDG
jgi:hypothetical protein